MYSDTGLLAIETAKNCAKFYPFISPLPWKHKRKVVEKVGYPNVCCVISEMSYSIFGILLKYDFV